VTSTPLRLPAGPDDGLDGTTLELTVDAIAHGGHVIGRYQGQVVFVRHALPGERVRALVTEEHRDYLRADAVEILDASPHRVTPPCPWAGPGRCGGCDLQHADLAYQRELKAAVVREQLIRLGGLSASTVDDLGLTVRALPTVPGEADGLGWRSRVQYTVDSTGRAGLLAHRSHEVVPVDRCLIAHAAVRDTDVLRRPWPEQDLVEVVAGSPATLLARRAGAPPAVVDGPATVTEQAVGRGWRLPPAAFWQVHPSAADTLAGAVVELLEPRPGDRIWDLYGGAGLFAAALAPYADATGRLTVVEADAMAAAAARENLRDLTTVTVVESDVARALRNPRWRAVDLVVLDPPRSGAGREVVTAVAARGPRAVAYVACDPAALARDLRSFRAQGYELRVLRAYDLFPHTHHVECVALLTPA
jgi:tRNA/tmRNA/rRNA uracil-C5-methylase (TrmA/RlmC/RlmD family)